MWVCECVWKVRCVDTYDCVGHGTVGVLVYRVQNEWSSFSSKSDCGMELNLHRAFCSFLHTHTQVNPTSLDLDHAHIQITHVEPYFTSEELQERRTKFERENKISRFVFETPFTLDGRAHGQVTQQCMRKTILTSTCSGHSVQWFHSIQWRGSIPFSAVVPFHSVEWFHSIQWSGSLPFSGVVPFHSVQWFHSIQCSGSIPFS